jgi:predicted nucleotidyltransferase
MNTEPLKDKLSTILARLEGMRLVYLFGSQVEGRLGPIRDFDLAVLTDPTADGRRIEARLAHELSAGSADGPH